MRTLFRRFAPALILVCAACGASNANTGAGAATASPTLTGSATVLAASSLTSAFKAAGAQFEKAHPGATVSLSFGGSATLIAQLQQGAPGDVFASADQPNMQKAVDAGLVNGSPRVFARNKLEIVVRPGNPKGIKQLSDLARTDVVSVLCAPAVPCGRYAVQALSKARASVKPASQETDVKAVVSKVAIGEADAGIVYVTDVLAAGSTVADVTIPDSQNVVATYPIAALKGASNSQVGQAFIAYLLSVDGQKTLARFGFSAP